MMKKDELINNFIALSSVAMVGVSSDPKRFGAVAFRELRKKGWKVFPVNPKIETIGEEKCYKSIHEIPFPVEGVISMVPKISSIQIARECKQLGIPYLWVQQKSESPETMAFCQENGLNAVFKECILMHYPPVTSIHAVHRWLSRLFRRN